MKILKAILKNVISGCAEKYKFSLPTDTNINNPTPILLL